MHDAIVISDLHLGSENCQASSLIAFLSEIRTDERPTKRLILNGDLFDSFDFRRLKKKHWKVLSLLRKLSDHVEVIWINGNHDGPAEIVSHLLGVDVMDEFIFDSGRRRILMLHGHRFDQFIDNYPWTTWLADRAYRLLQKLDRNQSIARTAKKSSNLFLRCARQIQERSVNYARYKGCQVVCCGHTHHAVEKTCDGVAYYNSGSWTETPCHYLCIQNGTIELCSYSTSTIEEHVHQSTLAVSH